MAIKEVGVINQYAFLSSCEYTAGMQLVADSNLSSVKPRGKPQYFKKNKFSTNHALVLLKYLSLTILFSLLIKSGYTQNDTSQHGNAYDSTKTKYDSATNKLYHHIREFGYSEQRKNLREYIEDSIATRQDETIDLTRKLILEAQNKMESGFDTTGLSTELSKIRHWFDITGDGVFTNTGTMQTYGNLETSFKILRELLTRLTDKKSSLDEYYKTLLGLRNKIDSLHKEDILYKFSSDSAVLMRYAERLVVAFQEIRPIDSALDKTLISLTDLQLTLNKMINRLSSSIDQIATFQRVLSSNQFRRETSNLGGAPRFNRRFDEIIDISMIKGWVLFIFFVRNEIGKILLMLMLVIACTILLVHLKQNLRSQGLLDENNPQQYTLKYPFLSAVVVVLNVFQFVFIDPPFVFKALIWFISGLFLTFILKNIVAKYWVAAWLLLFILFLLACFDGLILQASRTERWIMLALSIAGIICGGTIMLQGHRRDLKMKFFIYFIGFTVIMQIASILSNSFGRYNISKTCLTAGYFNLVLAILFFWTLQFIYQGFVLASRVYDKSDKKLFNISSERQGDKLPPLFYVFLSIGWIILFARNFYSYKLISVPVLNFFIEKRTIGEFSFTIGKVFEFFLILYISGMISRIVSFFAIGNPSDLGNEGRKSGIGSWLLIVRVSIITIGVLVAFAALGIPMDRLTIILSALSVGIGFGLQSLVNNLVSGLIIAFEKPFSIGDTVEIAGQSGTIKSIGFRSSIISAGTGAEIVIPNGDMLNQHLINWTRENSFRSVDIPVRVAYGTNLEDAINILTELPTKDGRILSAPKPTVDVKQFNNSSIGMQLTFWVKNITDVSRIKSDIILAIDSAFKKNSIRIPFQELYISSLKEEKSINKSEDEKK